MSWILTVLGYLYILEGIPYGIQSRFLPLVLRNSGVSLTALGFYKALYIPWLLKSLYAPFVETYFSKRAWLLASLSGLLAVTLIFVSGQILLPQSSHESDKPIAQSSSVLLIACCLFLFNFCAATQDIAVDGLALSLLSTNELAVGNTIQVVGYKLGGIMGGGLLTTLSVWFSVRQLFSLIAFVYMTGIVLCASRFVLVEAPGEWRSWKRSLNSNDERTNFSDDARKQTGSAYTTDWMDESRKRVTYWDALQAALNDSPRTRAMILLLLIYKLGEQGVMNMLPLLLLDRGASMARIGFWTGMVGQITSIAGSTMGYKFQNMGCPSDETLLRLMSVRAVLQLPLLLIAVGSFGMRFPEFSFVIGICFMNATLFVSGATTTVMFTLMMQCTRSESTDKTQATHYTVLSTAELLGKLVFGMIAAPMTDFSGYAFANITFFLLSLLPIHFLITQRSMLNFMNVIQLS